MAVWCDKALISPQRPSKKLVCIETQRDPSRSGQNCCGNGVRITIMFRDRMANRGVNQFSVVSRQYGFSLKIRIAWAPAGITGVLWAIDSLHLLELGRRAIRYR